MNKKPGWEADILEEELPPVPHDTNSRTSDLTRNLQAKYTSIISSYKSELLSRSRTRRTMKAIRG